jgi:Uma2 family endonuclease
MADRTILLTYRDYCELPADGRRYEIHDGELSVTPAPNPRHQRLVGAIYKALDAHVRSRGLGEVLLSPLDVILSDIAIVQPDVIYLERSRAGAVSSRGIEGAPTLAVEILSPWTAAIDRQRKPQLYARYGVPFYWIVDPEARAVEAQALGPGGYVHAGRLAGEERAVLPPLGNLVLDAGALWREAAGEA